jgi:cold shock CspA family protein
MFMQGTIKVLKDGYGFIATEDGDVFFHANNLVNAEYDELKKDDVLSFEMGEGRNGKEQAVEVELMEEVVED